MQRIIHRENLVHGRKTASGGPRGFYWKTTWTLPSERLNWTKGTDVSGCDFVSDVLFQGREYEPELNLYYYRARYYDPMMGRFLQTDPIGYRDSMNLYQALNQNPVNFIDPFGMYFRIPRNDPNRDRILTALAKGALTKIGAPVFWKIFNDLRPVTIQTASLTRISTTVTTGNIQITTTRITCGEIDPTKIVQSQDHKVLEVPISISFDNINYFFTPGHSPNIIGGLGKVDREGITTLFHELYHASNYLEAAPGTDYTLARVQRWITGQERPIVLGGSPSTHGLAQMFGQTVYDQYIAQSLIPVPGIQRQINSLIDQYKELIDKRQMVCESALQKINSVSQRITSFFNNLFR